MQPEHETVEVRVQATERVQYFQTVRLPKAEFERLSAALDGHDRGATAAAEETIAGMLDYGDVCGTDRFELETFELATPDG